MDARSKDAEAGSKLRLVFEKQDLALNFKAAAAVLPSPEVLDKILRYETKLDR